MPLGRLEPSSALEAFLSPVVNISIRMKRWAWGGGGEEGGKEGRAVLLLPSLQGVAITGFQRRCPIRRGKAHLGHPPGQVRECESQTYEIPFLFQKDCFCPLWRTSISSVFPLRSLCLSVYIGHISGVDQSVDAPAWEDIASHSHRRQQPAACPTDKCCQWMGRGWEDLA